MARETKGGADVFASDLARSGTARLRRAMKKGFAQAVLSVGVLISVGALGAAEPAIDLPASTPAEAPAGPAPDYAGAVKVTRLLKSTTDAAGRPIVYPKLEDGQAEVTALLVEIAPGGETGWHKHPLACFAYLMEGEIEVTLADGRVNVVRAGEALCEVVDLAHNGVNRGTVPAKLVMFALGTEGGGPFTVRVPAPEGFGK
jgi:quercetin dioxygenase-like cupin family protein